MKGILFKPDMIEAIVEGRKTQTRRVIRPQPAKGLRAACVDAISPKPRYQVGETVYIKEGWRIVGRGTSEFSQRLEVQYKIDMSRQWFSVAQATFHKYTFDVGWGVNSKWRSPLFMPEWAARHFITITGVRAERLQEITPADCQAEGINVFGGWQLSRHKFRELWNSINPKHPWESNPWVFAYTFRRDR